MYGTLLFAAVIGWIAAVYGIYVDSSTIDGSILSALGCTVCVGAVIGLTREELK